MYTKNRREAGEGTTEAETAYSTGSFIHPSSGWKWNVVRISGWYEHGIGGEPAAARHSTKASPAEMVMAFILL